MAWKTPKTDWAANDEPIKDDFNRIEGNIKDNHERIEEHEDDIANHTNILNNHDSRISNSENGITILTNKTNNHEDEIANIISRQIYYYEPSDNILAESLSENNCYLDAGEEAELKEFIIPAQFGKFRVTFDVWVEITNNYHYVVVVYDEKGNSMGGFAGALDNPATWTTVSRDLSVFAKPGYKIRLGVSLGGSHYYHREGRIRNARIRGSIVVPPHITGSSI